MGYEYRGPFFFGKVTTGAYVLAILLLVACPAHADEWTKEDTYREAAYLALHVADWGQTLEVANHPDEYHETNPVLGSHPSRGRVNAYFIATGILHPVVSYVLPRPYRELWQYGTIGIEIICVGNNAAIGVGFGF